MTKEIQRFCKENKHLSTRRVANNRQSLELGFFSKNFSRYNISKKSLVSMYVIDGQGTYTSPSGQKQELKPGTFLLRTPNTIHSIERDSTKDWIEFFIIFPETMFQYLQGNNFLPPVNECLDIGIDLFWLDKLKKLILSIQKLTPAKDMQAFHETIDHFMKLKEKISPISNTHQNEEDMLTLCKYIDDNPSRRFTNFELAEKAGYGLENFRKIFREIIGCSPQDYLIRCRIQHAQQMLWENKVQLLSIAMDLGYPDLASFSRQFKKITGKSPTNYRKSNP